MRRAWTRIGSGVFGTVGGIVTGIVGGVRCSSLRMLVSVGRHRAGGFLVERALRSREHDAREAGLGGSRCLRFRGGACCFVFVSAGRWRFGEYCWARNRFFVATIACLFRRRLSG